MDLDKFFNYEIGSYLKLRSYGENELRIRFFVVGRRIDQDNNCNYSCSYLCRTHSYDEPGGSVRDVSASPLWLMESEVEYD